MISFTKVAALIGTISSLSTAAYFYRRDIDEYLCNLHQCYISKYTSRSPIVIEFEKEMFEKFERRFFDCFFNLVDLYFDDENEPELFIPKVEGRDWYLDMMRRVNMKILGWHSGDKELYYPFAHPIVVPDWYDSSLDRYAGHAYGSEYYRWDDMKTDKKTLSLSNKVLYARLWSQCSLQFYDSFKAEFEKIKKSKKYPDSHSPLQEQWYGNYISFGFGQVEPWLKPFNIDIYWHKFIRPAYYLLNKDHKGEWDDPTVKGKLHSTYSSTEPQIWVEGAATRTKRGILPELKKEEEEITIDNYCKKVFYGIDYPLRTTWVSIEFGVEDSKTNKLSYIHGVDDEIEPYLLCSSN